MWLRSFVFFFGKDVHFDDETSGIGLELVCFLFLFLFPLSPFFFFFFLSTCSYLLLFSPITTIEPLEGTRRSHWPYACSIP